MGSFQGLGSIGQIALTVGDAQAATAYYRDRLGMRHLFSAPPGMTFFDCGGVRLLLGESEIESESGSGGGEEGPVAGSGGTVVYFRVPDIEAVHASLVERAVEFVEDPRKVAELEDTELWLGFFRDPWGNVLALMSEVPA